MKIQITYLKTNEIVSFPDLSSVTFEDGKLTAIFDDGCFIKLEQKETPFEFAVFS